MPTPLFATPLFVIDAWYRAFSVRLGRFEFFIEWGSSRPRPTTRPGEIGFDALGTTIYLINHARFDKYHATPTQAE